MGQRGAVGKPSAAVAGIWQWLIHHWHWADGLYILHRGESLKTLGSRELYSVAYYLLMEHARITKEEDESQERTREILEDKDTERETGMPSLPSWVPRADAFAQAARANAGMMRRR